MRNTIMAIRERKGRKSPWQCYWNNPLTGKREGVNFATRMEAEKHDSLIKHRIRFDRESFKEEEEHDEPYAATLESCYLLYLREKQFNRSGLKWQMDSMRTPLEKIGAIPVTDITPSHISSIMSGMFAEKVKPVTVRGRLSVLRTVCRWCASHGYMPPLEFPKLPPAHYERIVPPTPEEIIAILCAVQSEHLGRAVILGSQLGVRVGPSEMFGLTWDDVDLDRRVLRIHGSQKNRQAVWREVPIKSSLITIFNGWRESDNIKGINLLVHYDGKKISSLKTAWRLALRRAGITRRIRLYDLRHAFGTNMIAAGADVGTVANLMGHSTPVMLLTHYQYVLDRQKVAAIEALPDIEHVSSIMCPKINTRATMQ